MYSLSESRRKLETLVASPKQIGNKPHAAGSKLPVCPAFAAWKHRLTICKTRLDVMPSGLFNKRMPFTERPLCRLPIVYRRSLILFQRIDKATHMTSSFNGFIINKVYTGDAFGSHDASYFMAIVTCLFVKCS